MRHDSFFELLLGFALIFASNLIINIFSSGKKAPPLVRLILCTAFTYGISVIRELFQFFSDYYNEDSVLQDYSYCPDEDMLFFKLFGCGSAQTGQYALMDTDLDFLCMMIGCAAGGGLLLLIYTLKAKRQAVKAGNNGEKKDGSGIEKIYAE